MQCFLCSFATIVYIYKHSHSLYSTEPSSAMIGFSQPSYSVMEGGAAVNVCIIVTSLTGQLINNRVGAFIGFRAINGSLVRVFTTSASVSFMAAQVGDPLLCLPVPNAEDNFVEEDIPSTITAFIEGPDSISFTEGGARTTVLVTDNDGIMFCM